MAANQMPKWQKSPPELIDRFDELLPPDPRIQRKKMFGYPAAFVNGKMFTGLFQDSMVLKLDVGDLHQFLCTPGAAEFEPMPGRKMGGFAVFPPEMLRDEKTTRHWLVKSLEFVGSLPAAKPKAKKKTASRAK